MFPLFLARRFFNVSQSGASKASQPAIKVAMWGIAVGMCIIMLSVSIVSGFKREVNEKLRGVANEAVLTDFRALESPESYPVVIGQDDLEGLMQVGGVRHAERYAEKMGMFKTNEEFSTFDLKGLSPEYEVDFFKSCLVAGKIPNFAEKASDNDIVLSQTLARKLHLKVGDKVYAYFFEETVKTRRFKVAGIYETYIKEFDNNVALGSMRTVCKLNGWTSNECSGVDLRLDNDRLDNDALLDLKAIWNGREMKNGGLYTVLGARENPRTAAVYSWLGLMDVNVWVILVLVTMIAAFSMISGLLILILERINTIGLLKALGATNKTIRQTFLAYAAMIVGKGLLIGDILAVLLIGVQKYSGVIRLNPDDYYVSAVPVDFVWWWLLLLNIVAFIIIIVMLILPSYAVGKISPAKTMQME